MTGNKPRIPPDSMRYATVGVEFLAVFLAGLLVGLWADRRWDTRPTLTLVGTALGFAGGMYRLVRVARSCHREHEAGPSDED